MLRGEHITVRYGSKTAADDVSFRLEEGQWLMLVGPNGAGKTTLIEAVARGVPYEGNIFLEGQDMRTVSANETARKIGVLAQGNRVDWAYTVEEVVGLGRYAWRSGLFHRGDGEGKERVEEALAMTGLADLRNRSMQALSGGETQRVFLAQVFAQNPRILILDEPANHLDLKYQEQIFFLIGEWLAKPGRAVMSVVHDLSLAKRYGTHALMMHEGRCAAQGTTGDVLTREGLQEVFGLDVYGWMREMLGQWQ